MTVLITGGAGYVGSVLVPKLLNNGYKVKVLDLYIYGNPSPHFKENLIEIKGDIRNQSLLKECLKGVDAVIHLACISNDPSVELNPELSRTINFDAFGPLVKIAKENGVKRFIYASSASVYGVSDEPNITEEHPLLPISDYNRYKALCEPILHQEQSSEFTTVTIRPATLCGYSPRQRFDLTVNILTNHAVNKGKITVFGGSQQRPNLHIEDMVDLYIQLLQEEESRIAGKIFNAGYQNFTISEIAESVKSIVEQEISHLKNIPIDTTPSDDIRSYRISSEKIKNELNFTPKRTIKDAVRDLCNAFRSGKYDNPLTNEMFYNIKRMHSINLQ